jgi:hypothetical protein
LNHGQHYGAFFYHLLENTQIPASKIVIEVLENRVSDEQKLTESIQYYRNLGCLLAIDDFGAGHSNIDRVLRLEPEIVKLDRQLLFNTNAKARRILTNLVALLHEAGSLVIFEGIETIDEALLAYEIDVDMVQGFFFSKPCTSPYRDLPDSLFQRILEKLEQHQDAISRQRHIAIADYQLAFQHSISSYLLGADFAIAAKNLLQTEGIQRAYVVDEEGYLINDNWYSKHFVKSLRPQMKPMHQVKGINLYNRHYFQRARNHPGTIQVTRPYLSTTDAELCITLSQGIEIDGRIEVICCDIEVPENV